MVVMVRRRSTVRFRKGALIRSQIRTIEQSPGAIPGAKPPSVGAALIWRLGQRSFGDRWASSVISAATSCRGHSQCPAWLLNWSRWTGWSGSVSKSSFVGVRHGCQFARPARGIPLASGPVVTQDPEGLMQRPLPAVRATRCAADDLDVAAASCARRPAVTWPPVDDDRAWLPEVTEAAVLREAGKRRASWLFHAPYPNI
jgi:hypothetical protein